MESMGQFRAAAWKQTSSRQAGKAEEPRVEQGGRHEGGCHCPYSLPRPWSVRVCVYVCVCVCVCVYVCVLQAGPSPQFACSLCAYWVG